VTEYPTFAARRTAPLGRFLGAVLLALLVLTALPAPQASAATPAPTGLKASGITQTSALLSWKAVPKAPKYRIQYSTQSSMAGAVYRR